MRLFGILDYNHSLNKRQMNRILNVLSTACEVRGTDATGIAYNHNGKLRIYKRPIPAHLMRFNVPDGVNAVMGHTRMTTQGSEKLNFNNHPFYGKADVPFALAHNGVIYTMIVESISRFARNTRDLLELVEQLTKKRVEFVSKKEAIDTTTPTGKFMLTIFGAVAELEREYILQRQREGIAIAKENGIYKGRIAKPCPEFETVASQWKSGRISAVEAMKQLGMKKTTFYRRIKGVK